MATSPDNLRFLRPVPDLIPWYLRVGYSDHRLVENKLSGGDTRINRAVMRRGFAVSQGPSRTLLFLRAFRQFWRRPTIFQVRVTAGSVRMWS